MLRRVLIKPLSDQAANELRYLKNLHVAVPNSKPPYENACLFTSLMILLTFFQLYFSWSFGRERKSPSRITGTYWSMKKRRYINQTPSFILIKENVYKGRVHFPFLTEN